jgi:hypothetical protein
MKRDQSKDGTPSSATPGEPPPAETPEAPPVVPPAEPDIIPSAESKEVPDLPLISEELPTGLESLGRKGGTFVRLSDGIEVSLEGFGQFALQLQAQNRKMVWDDIIPLAASRLCQVKRFFGGLEAGELEFVATHGRRWKAGEGFLLSAEGLEKAPEIDKLVFEPANLEASCKMLRVLFPRAKLARRNPTLAEHVRECHKALHRAQEARKAALRARGEPEAYGIARQSYSAFAHGELAFVGSQIGFLWDYLDLRGKRVRPATAERRVCAKRRVLGSTP